MMMFDEIIYVWDEKFVYDHVYRMITWYLCFVFNWDGYIVFIEIDKKCRELGKVMFKNLAPRQSTNLTN